jgi:hypothetical protein
MQNMAAKSTDLRLSGLDIRPMLTAMTVYLFGFGVAALVVAFAVGRQTSCTPNPQTFHQPYMVLTAPNVADRGDPHCLNANISNRRAVSDQGVGAPALNS